MAVRPFRTLEVPETPMHNGLPPVRVGVRGINRQCPLKGFQGGLIVSLSTLDQPQGNPHGRQTVIELERPLAMLNGVIDPLDVVGAAILLPVRFAQAGMGERKERIGVGRLREQGDRGIQIAGRLGVP